MNMNKSNFGEYEYVFLKLINYLSEDERSCYEGPVVKIVLEHPNYQLNFVNQGSLPEILEWSGSELEANRKI